MGLFRWWRCRKREGDMGEGAGVREARMAREEAEQRLAITQRELIIPLRDMHKENHVQPLINGLIQRRVRRESG